MFEHQSRKNNFYRYLKTALMGILLSLGACQMKPNQKETNELSKQALIQGTWQSGQWDLYHTLYFQDSIHLVIDNHIDTLFFYEYRLIGDSLVLYQEYGKVENYNPILRLDTDSLILEGFLDRGEIMRYARKTP